MKRQISLFLMFVLLMTTTAGCSFSKKNTDANTTDVSQKEEIVEKVDNVNDAEDKVTRDEKVFKASEVLLIEAGKLKYDVDKETGSANITMDKHFRFEKEADIDAIMTAFGKATEEKDLFVETSPQYAINVIEKDATKSNTYYLWLEGDTPIVMIGEVKYFKLEQEGIIALTSLFKDDNAIKVNDVTTEANTDEIAKNEKTEDAPVDENEQKDAETEKADVEGESDTPEDNPDTPVSNN